MTTPTYSSFFYSGQIRRFLQQFIRVLSNFQVQMGNDDEGNAVLQRVPVYYGDASRQASQILRGNSENALNSLPAMAVYISAMRYDVNRIQEPNFVSKMNIRTRAVDPETGEYTNQQGDAYIFFPNNKITLIDQYKKVDNVVSKLFVLNNVDRIFHCILKFK
jgi:hypothetical protein